MHGHGSIRRRRRPRLGGGGAQKLPVGTTFGFVGDGIMSQAAAGGSRNMGDWFLALMGLRLQPVPVWNLAVSGTVIARTVGANANVWINPIAVDALAAQKPDVAIFGTCGHNDGILATDPDANATFLNDWKDALTRHVTSNPQALLIPVMGTWPSTASETAAIRTKVWTRQQAHAASFADPRIVWVDVSGADPLVANANDTGRTHPDKDGGQLGGALLFAAVSPRVTAATPAQVQAMIDAGTYPLMGTQVDADRTLAGTGGAATAGMQAGSQVATSKLVSNATGATVSSAMASAGAYNKVVVTLSGTATADGNVVVGDKSALAVAGVTPGQGVLTGFGVRVPAGLNRLGSLWGNFGLAMDGVPGSSDTISDQPTTTALDTIWATAPLPVYGGTGSATRSLYLRYRSGDVLSGTLEVYQPFAWVVRDRLRHKPVYLGELKAAGTGTVISGLAYRLRPTGTVTAAAGGTVRVEVGKWAPHGLTEADFAARRVYKGGAGDTGIGSGTLLATLSGSVWTYAVAAGACAAGDLLYVEVDANNGIGGTVTARSVATVVVG